MRLRDTSTYGQEMRRVVAGLAVLVITAGCTGDRPQSTPSRVPSSTPSASSASPSASTYPSPRQRTRSSPRPTAQSEPSMNAAAAIRDVRRLGSGIGPREATSANFFEAADLVQARFERIGYHVRQTAVRVPAGNSWGTPVKRGTSANIIAEPRGFDSRKPHVVVGAHLDTVSRAPGAEDNASGIAVMLELARMTAQQPHRLPVRFIAFGAEEPRGPGDALHHFGSRQHVAELSRAERDAIAGMLALDRVGVRADAVPVCQGGPAGTRLRTAVRRAGNRADIATQGCENRTSDHWSYEKVAVPAVRLGSIPYAAYHSRRDLPDVVSRNQLDRVGRLVWSWLSGLD